MKNFLLTNFSELSISLAEFCLDNVFGSFLLSSLEVGVMVAPPPKLAAKPPAAAGNTSGLAVWDCLSFLSRTKAISSFLSSFFNLFTSSSFSRSSSAEISYKKIYESWFLEQNCKNINYQQIKNTYYTHTLKDLKLRPYSPKLVCSTLRNHFHKLLTIGLRVRLVNWT